MGVEAMAADIKFIPLSVPHLSGNEKKYVNQCIDENWISSSGRFIAEFEERIAEYTGADNAVAVMNGTCALHLSLLAAGIERNTELFVPTLTFIAPINAIRYVGACPLFIDVDPLTLGLSPEALENFIRESCTFNGHVLVNNRTGRRISAIVPVHLYGHCCDMPRIIEIAGRYKLKVIEDAAEAIGSRWDGIHAGTFGDIGCFSFNGNKLLTTGGGGMVVTRDGALARWIRHLSTQAKTDEFFYYHDEVGFNYRMLNIQAAIGLGQLEHLDEMIAKKRRIAKRYATEFQGLKNMSFFAESGKCMCTYWFFLLFLEDKGRLGAFCDNMKEKKIQVRPFWGMNHTHRMFSDFDRGDLSQSIRMYETGICIPCNQGMEEEDVERVVSAVKEFADE